MVPAEGASEILPDAVKNLLQECLNSFESLELLLALHAHAGEAFTIESLCKRVGVAPDLGVAALEDLTAKNLVRRSTIEPMTYRFAPATAGLDTGVAELSRLYRERRAAIVAEMSINAISRIRSSSLRAFSDAFVIGTRKKESDG